MLLTACIPCVGFTLFVLSMPLRRARAPRSRRARHWGVRLALCFGVPDHDCGCYPSCSNYLWERRGRFLGVIPLIAVLFFPIGHQHSRSHPITCCGQQRCLRRQLRTEHASIPSHCLHVSPLDHEMKRCQAGENSLKPTLGLRGGSRAAIRCRKFTPK